MLKTTSLFILLALTSVVRAQKNIVISDSLLANSQPLNVELKDRFIANGAKFHFGDYAIVSVKSGWGTSTSKTNFLSTKSESTSKDKFSFVLCNKSSDTARVNAVNNVNIKTSQELRLSRGFSFGSNEVLEEAYNFYATIAIDDTASDWALIMNVVKGQSTTNMHEAVLTNGERRITINPVTSNKNGDDKRLYLAFGYEMMENNQSLCAVQYCGGGLLGIKRKIVWLSNSLDGKMKMLLAAAISTILELQM